jgi:hypothetical protein
MLSVILFILGLAVILVLAIAMSKPDEFRVERRMSFKASPEKIFPHLNNLKLGQQWSPWVRMDPKAHYTFSGPSEGVGASLEWSGKKSGAGKMTIMESTPDKRVRFRLEFFRPMKSVNITEYALMQNDEETVMDWSMFGPNNFLGKLMSVFMNCEKRVGDQFVQGMSNLKTIVEK